MELRGFEDSPEKERSQRATRQKQQEKEKQEREREKAKKQAASEEAAEAAKKETQQLQQQGQSLSSVEEGVASMHNYLCSKMVPNCRDDTENVRQACLV